jgi:hypothetical protein
MKIQTILFIIVAASLTASPWTIALAEVDNGRTLDSVISDAADGVFTENERQLISEYFNKHRDRDDDDDQYDESKHKKNKKGKKQKGLPPGLAKKKQLPPGLQKQLDRNGTLPPGLAKRNLPPDLETRLPPVDSGMERVIADTHVVLVDKATGIIRDIIKDIVQ